MSWACDGMSVHGIVTPPQSCGSSTRRYSSRLRYYPLMEHVNAPRKSDRALSPANAPRVGPAVALTWTVLAIAYVAASWIYGVRPLIEVYQRSALHGWQLYDVAVFAVGYAFIALATLVCAVSALLRLRCYGEYRMDKLWLIAALLGTLSFPIPMLMPADMKPRIGMYATFSWYGLATIVGILALMFLIGLICVPFIREARDGS